jgi:hypothetical protein
MGIERICSLPREECLTSGSTSPVTVVVSQENHSKQEKIQATPCLEITTKHPGSPCLHCQVASS